MFFNTSSIRHGWTLWHIVLSLEILWMSDVLLYPYRELLVTGNKLRQTLLQKTLTPDPFTHTSVSDTTSASASAMCVCFSHHNVTAGYEVMVHVYTWLPSRYPYAGHSACGPFNTSTCLVSWIWGDRETLVVKQFNVVALRRRQRSFATFPSLWPSWHTGSSAVWA